MGNLAVYIVVAAGLFAVAFFTKRRFGVLGLALAAGSILSGYWSYDGSLVVGLFNVPSSAYANALVSSIILLLPALALILLSGGKYKTVIGRVVGSGLFAILAISFLFEMLSRVFPLTGAETATLYTWFANNRQVIITVGLVVAVLDIVLNRSKHLPETNRKH